LGDEPEIELNPNHSLQTQVMDTGLSRWTGGEDLQSQIATLPTRLDYDKKQGFFHCEEFRSVKLSAKLIAATTIWAIWTEQIGQPEGPIVAGAQPSARHEMGFRLILEIDDFLYYLDCFGLMFKVAQSATRRAHKNEGMIYWVDRKAVMTRFGQFFLPQIEQIDEASL